jgi:hypothetical protein
MSNLSEICYQQIKDDYWYGCYLGMRVVMQKSTGFINASKLCIDGGKRFKNWTRLEHSKEMIKYFENALQTPNSIPANQVGRFSFETPANENQSFQSLTSKALKLTNEIQMPDLRKPHKCNVYHTVCGGKGDELIRGVYVHPLLIPHIASWVSLQFGHAVSMICK